MTIITSSGSRVQTNGWQRVLQQAIRNTRELGDALGLELPETGTDFGLLVPRPFLSRMKPGDPRDPLLLQVLIQEAENVSVAGYSGDPLQEQAATGETGLQPDRPRGLLQKYQGRVLVVTTGACAINCRYCFRRHFPYQDYQPDRRAWEQIIAQIRADSSLTEVILSGGDPLVMNDRFLADLAAQLAGITHITTLRIHTRLPVVIPQRVCDELIAWISTLPLQVVIVTHINHGNEIDSDVITAMGRLAQAGATLLNQSVLLKDINDDADTLTDLSQQLFKAGILPYYLHLLDPVDGAAHFDTSEKRARALMRSLTSRLPGYLVPRLVREVPGTDAKQLRFPG